MKFQIDEVAIDGVRLKLSNSEIGLDNVYTMVVGRNAVGKTRLLSKIVNSYVFAGREGADDCWISESFDSMRKPSQVVAISNSRFDRFPKADILFRQRAFSINYHYLGLSGNRSFPLLNISKSIASVIHRSKVDADLRESLSYIFHHIGLASFLQFELRVGGFGLHPGAASSEARWREMFDRLNSEGSEIDYDTEILPALEYLNAKRVNVRYDLQNGWLETQPKEIAKYLPALMSSGLLKIFRMNLFSLDSKKKMLFNEASSGQQCMLLMFLGIAGSIKDGSLVCIDEPEISLHPRWQAEFIGILQGAFSSYKGCHFLIATHSPQLVSGLTSSKGYVADLERDGKLLHSTDYAKKSADFQLSEIFHEPGFRNEYLTRILLVMVSRLSKGERLSIDDREKLEAAEAIRDRLDRADPILHLLNQIKMLAA